MARPIEGLADTLASYAAQPFLPDIEADSNAAFLTMPLGTSAEATGEALRQIELAALELGEELEEQMGGQPIRHVLTTIGAQPKASIMLVSPPAKLFAPR